VTLLFVCRRYWPAIGGVETFLRDLARALGENHRVKVLAHTVANTPTGRLTDSLRPPPTFVPFSDGPVRVEPLRISLGRRAAMAPLITQAVPVLRRYAYGRARLVAARLYASTVAPVIAQHGQSADVVHMFGSDLVAAAAMRAAGLLGVPGVVTPFAHRRQWGVGPADAAAYRAATCVIAQLEADADLYRDLGVPQERLAICGVGSPGVPAGHGAAIRERFGISGPLVLFLGVRRPYKGFDRLVDAAPFVTSKRSDVTFAIVGPGPKLSHIPADARIIDVDRKVPDLERAGWLEAADVLCVPSEGESFGAVVTEAWSVGTPAIVADIPTSRELVSKARGGLAVSPEPRSLAAAILGLVSDPDQARALGESGRSYWSAHYTVSAVAHRHERLYASLREQQRQPRPAPNQRVREEVSSAS
jgi:glycosyltransferase involved in cell wall biosynthesis